MKFCNEMLIRRLSATYPTEFERCGKAKMRALQLRLAHGVIAGQGRDRRPNGPAFGRRGDLGPTAPKTFGAGGKGIRTPGLLIANETLYQLSYTPIYL